MNDQPYDLIGDIHGQYDKLTALLSRLGYQRHGQGFLHAEGRKVVFLGDYIDRGPKVREVLMTVRAMVESGDALAIMGNHEYNAVCYHEPDGKGGWLRERGPKRDDGLKVTLAQFENHQAEWAEWLIWMRGLPLFLDLGRLRAVHACWDVRSVAAIEGQSLGNDAFLHASAKPGTPEYRAVETLLKGPEMAMPDDHVYRDKEGIERSAVRVRWWDVPPKARVSTLAMPQPFDVPGDATADELAALPNYSADAPPVFFGHYWLPATFAKAPLRHNIACLDYSAAREGPLVAYRWERERELTMHRFIVSNI